MRRIQRRAVSLVRIPRRHQQARRVHRQRAVAVANRIVCQPDTQRAARIDRVTTDRRVAHAAGTGQRHVRHAVIIQQTSGGELRRVQRRAVNLVCVPRRDEQARRAHRQRAVAIADAVVRQAGAQCGARNDRIAAHRRIAHAAGAGQRHVRHTVAVQQASRGVIHQVQRRAINFVRVPRRDHQARRAHGQRAVAVADAVVRQARSLHAARNDRMTPDRRVAHAAGTGQRHIRHAVTVQQARHRELSRDQRRAINLVRARRRDQQARRVHRQRAVAVADVVIRQAGAAHTARGDVVAAHGRVAHAAAARQRHVRHAVAVQQARRGVIHRVQRRAVNLVRARRRDQQARRIHRQRPVAVTDAVIRQAHAQRAACHDGVAAHGRIAHAAGTGQRHVRHGVAVEQARDGERRRVQRRAINLVRVPRRDQQTRRVHRQHAVAVTDRVVRQAGAGGAAGDNGVVSDGRVAHAAAAGQRHVRHRVPVHQSRRRIIHRAQRRPVNLVRAARRDQQARCVHRQRARCVGDQIIARTHAHCVRHCDRIAADGGGGIRARTGHRRIRQRVPVEQRPAGDGEVRIPHRQRGAINLVRVVRGQREQRVGHGQRAVVRRHGVIAKFAARIGQRERDGIAAHRTVRGRGGSEVGRDVVARLQADNAAGEHGVGRPVAASEVGGGYGQGRAVHRQHEAVAHAHEAVVHGQRDGRAAQLIRGGRHGDGAVGAGTAEDNLVGWHEAGVR